MKKARKILLITVLSVTGLCLLLVAFSAISNLGLPQKSAVTETLSAADKIRLAEAQHLRENLGNSVWPGWGDPDIPAIVYNESYVFLVGYPDPPLGWLTVPDGEQQGGPWETVSVDEFNGKPYYRQPLSNANATPQAFTVQVGSRWVSSLQTYDWARISLIEIIRQDLPGFLQPVFPYRLFVSQLISGSDQYITLAAHEAFHAYQGMTAPLKLAAAENANRRLESQYPWDSLSLQADWQTELDVLADALPSTDRATTLALAQNFLDLRAARRRAAGLSPELVAFEQQREWVEGLARYAELEIWQQAYTGDYTPLTETARLSDFDQYTDFETRWAHEIDQLTRMAGDEGDGRFYYSGMAQAYLLDRLMPGWKLRAFDQGVWLDELLAEAISTQ